MIGVEILSTGALKEAYLKQAAAEYEKRLSAYCRVSNLVYKPGASPAGLLKDKAYKVALCVEGDQLSSEELAETIKKAALSGRSRLQFVIGDSDGLPAQVKEKCELRLSFSKMTFPHQLMRVILLEQIYRSFRILKGEPYHK